MVIGNVDKLETVKIEKRLDRKERDKCRASNVLPILVETVDTSELVETTDLVQPAETVEPQVTELTKIKFIELCQSQETVFQTNTMVS